MAVFEISFFSDALGRIAPMTAIVPIERPHHYGGGGKPTNEPFRALYLLHGYSGTNTDWIRGSRIEQLAMAHNIAVFMPSGENGFYLDDPIRGANYSKLLCEDMIDFTRAVFPLSTRREATTIGGFSMGGYGALRNGLYRSDIFGNIIAFSSAIMTDELSHMREDVPNPIAPYSYYVHTFGSLDKVVGSDKDPKALAKAIVTESKPVPNIYIACGTEDFGIAQNRAYTAYLSEIGLNHIFMESPGAHNWVFWDEYIEKALLWLDEINRGNNS
jgi:S-formylglutathione hydrolase FrmB